MFRYRQWQANPRILEVYDIKIIPYSPTTHPFIERLIGNRVEEPFEENILISCFSGTLKSNVLNLITFPGDHTVMACFKLRSLHEFGFRHTQDAPVIDELDTVIRVSTGLM